MGENTCVRGYPGNEQTDALFRDYAAVHDRKRQQEYVRRRLSTADRREDPFPHVWVEDVLSPELYALLDAAWPVPELFPTEERANRRDMVPRPPGTNPADNRASTYDALPKALRDVWDFFILDINRAIVGPWLLDKFRDEIDERLALIDRLWSDGVVTKDYYQPPFRPQMNVGRLMMRGLGFRLRPHADALAYLTTALYYFPDERQDADLGTTLFRADRALDEAAVAASGKTVYFHESDIQLMPVFSAPFRRNALLAFVNSGRSAHGMEITSPGLWRRAYQSHISIKSDHHHL
jgi:hypothetical protein